MFSMPGKIPFVKKATIDDPQYGSFINSKSLIKSLDSYPGTVQKLFTKEEANNFDGVLISPGPGTPKEAGISIEMIKYCAQEKIPLFGVCLGHQAIAEAFGGKVSHAPELLHGKTSQVIHNGHGVLKEIPSPFTFPFIPNWS